MKGRNAVLMKNIILCSLYSLIYCADAETVGREVTLLCVQSSCGEETAVCFASVFISTLKSGHKDILI